MEDERQRDPCDHEHRRSAPCGRRRARRRSGRPEQREDHVGGRVDLPGGRSRAGTPCSWDEEPEPGQERRRELVAPGQEQRDQQPIPPATISQSANSSRRRVAMTPAVRRTGWPGAETVTSSRTCPRKRMDAASRFAPARCARRPAGSRSRCRGERRRVDPRRSRRRLQPRLHLPEGRRAQGAARRSRPAPHAADPPRRRRRSCEASWDEAFAEIDGRLTPILGRGPRRGRRLPRQPDRPQPRQHALRPRAARRRSARATSSRRARSTRCRSRWRAR